MRQRNLAGAGPKLASSFGSVAKQGKVACTHRLCETATAGPAHLPAGATCRAQHAAAIAGAHRLGRAPLRQGSSPGARPAWSAQRHGVAAMPCSPSPPHPLLPSPLPSPSRPLLPPWQAAAYWDYGVARGRAGNLATMSALHPSRRNSSGQASRREPARTARRPTSAGRRSSRRRAARQAISRAGVSGSCMMPARACSGCPGSDGGFP